MILHAYREKKFLKWEYYLLILFWHINQRAVIIGTKCYIGKEKAGNREHLLEVSKNSNLIILVTTNGY